MSQIETFRYDDEIVRKFLLATIVWGVVGLLLGVIIAHPAGILGDQLWPLVFLWPAQTAPHERSDFRLCRQRHVCRHLPFDPATLQGQDVQ